MFTNDMQDSMVNNEQYTPKYISHEPVLTSKGYLPAKHLINFSKKNIEFIIYS